MNTKNELAGLFQFIQEEIIKLHKIELLEAKKIEIEKQIKILEESDKKWMQKAFKNKKNSLHKALGISDDEIISVAEMEKATKNPKLSKKAWAAINANPDKYGKLAKKLKAKE